MIRLDTSIVSIIEDAFTDLVTKQTQMPPIMRVDVPEHNGELDIKSAYISGDDSFAVKLSSGFFNNSELGLPSSNGMMILIDSRTGRPLAVLADEGLLTELRTAAAGAVAAKYCSSENSRKAGVIGTGAQARLQLKALALVRPIERAFVYGRKIDHARSFKAQMEEELGIEVNICDTVKEVVERSNVVVTTTPSITPLIYAEWLHPGLHITAMGSDAEHKQELDASVLEKADLVVCDVKAQSMRLGELRSCDQSPVLEHVRELGSLTSGREHGRKSEEQITICDLTGTGVQDTAIARHVYSLLIAEEDVIHERSKI